MLNLITNAAIKAGRLLEIRFLEILNGKATKVKEKGKSDFVTKADIEVEEYLKELLSEANVPVIGEESYQGFLPDTCLVVDPIDGTRNFMRGNPHFALNVAYWEEGRIKIGVTYDPIKKELFWAEEGEGCYFNGEKVRVSSNGDISKALIAIGLPYRGRELVDVQTSLYRNIFLRAAATRHTGSAALDLAYVACGRYDGIVYFYLSPWDVMPGILMVKEAGGKVEGLMGRKPHEGWLVASNGALHDTIKELIPPEGR